MLAICCRQGKEVSLSMRFSLPQYLISHELRLFRIVQWRQAYRINARNLNVPFDRSVVDSLERPRITRTLIVGTVSLAENLNERPFNQTNYEAVLFRKLDFKDQSRIQHQC